MVYYDVKIKYELKEELTNEKLSDEIAELNRSSLHNRYVKAVHLVIIEHNENELSALLSFSQDNQTLSSAKKEALKHLLNRSDMFSRVAFSGKCEELGVLKALELTHEGYSNDQRDSHYSGRIICKAGYAENNGVKFTETVLSHSHTTYSDAVNEAHGLLWDKSAMEELERIYSPLNKHKFYGNPVHYKLNAASRETAKKDIELLVKALYSNSRLVSTRVTYVTDTDYDSFDNDFTKLCDNSYGSLVAIECNTELFDEDCYASDFERMCETVCEAISNYSHKTLFVLIVIGNSKKLADSIISKTGKNDVSFVELFEGSGEEAEAKKYLKTLLKENKVSYSKEDFVLHRKESYNTADIVDAFKDIRKNSIKNSIYKAYKEVRPVTAEKPKSVSNSYDKLQSMVGLTEIKSIIDQIISAQKLNKLRKDMGLEVADTAKHMIFTGNPGSAKTTVARLLASILYDEHVLSKSKFVECGRQDLVGKYVGWTAKQVEAKFVEAKGGILFIDEAYSLVEKGGYYGDEAINTIVQMMENYRDDVIVIFAGYPDKMKKFLEKNEGLRSRVAFHIDFPDYNGDELCDILKLMTKDRGYTLEAEAEGKCRNIFDIACKNAEFGNGRFVRNVLEQAIIKQSSRIFSQYNSSEVDKNTISILSAADFDINAAATYKSPKVAIGF